jgi:hypothetical protein
MITTMKEAQEHAGTISSKNKKMPCSTTSLPACECGTGSKLATKEGSVCFDCYALKGNYLFPSVQLGLNRRLSKLYDPKWVESMAFMINRRDLNGFFRWHDSGDIQSAQHLDNINQVCLLTPTVKHWIPTREIGIVLDWIKSGADIAPNLCIRISAPMVGSRLAKVLESKLEALGLTFSIVFDDPDNPALGDFFRCPAPDQNGSCGDCRACWNPKNKTTGYHKH